MLILELITLNKKLILINSNKSYKLDKKETKKFLK